MTLTFEPTSPPCPNCGAPASDCQWYGGTRRVYLCFRCARRR